VPADFTSDHDSFDRKQCSLVLFKIGFCRDLALYDKCTKKTEKYLPLLRALRRYWGRVDLDCIPIGHTGTTLNDTTSDIATALAKVRPSDVKGKSRTPQAQEPSTMSVIHDMQVANTLLDTFCSLAQTRRLRIIDHKNKKKKQKTNSH